jgi:uncharacterized damage-inducible protein DinB
MKMNPFIKRSILAGAFLFVVSATASAQLADSLKSALLTEWQRARDYTREVLEAMPRDRYAFRPTDSTRTFALQMLHLARMNFIMISFGTGEKSAWMQRNIEKSVTLADPDSVKFVVLESYDFAIQSIRRLDPQRLLERNKVGPFDLPRFLWLMKAFEHQTHHRGQTVVYLRLCGVVPPEEKLL